MVTMSHATLKPRDSSVDILRALSIVVMMIIHSNASFLNDPVSLWVWSYSQWVVPAFLLCSFLVGSYEVTSFAGYWRYAIARARRLLIPYYAWLGIYIALLWFLRGSIPSSSSLIANIFFTGGNDYNWLVLLFLQSTLLGPLIIYLLKKRSYMSWIVFALSLTASVAFVQNRGYWQGHYRLWLMASWTGIIWGILYFARLWQEKKYKAAGLFWLIAFVTYYVCSYVLVTRGGMRADMFYHKYPPDVIYFLFCLWTTPLAYLGAVYSAKIFSEQSLFIRIARHISVHSYTLFFIHICVLAVMGAWFTRSALSYQQYIIVLFAGTALVHLLMRGCILGLTYLRLKNKPHEGVRHSERSRGDRRARADRKLKS